MTEIAAKITSEEANAAREAHRAEFRRLEARVAAGGSRPSDEEQASFAALRLVSIDTFETDLFDDPAAEVTAAASAGRELLDNPDFIQAVQTARQHIPIQEATCIESCWSDFVIMRKTSLASSTDVRYAVAYESQWERPTSDALLGSAASWQPPTGERVAKVDHDGILTVIAPGKK